MRVQCWLFEVMQIPMHSVRLKQKYNAASSHQGEVADLVGDGAPVVLVVVRMRLAFVLRSAELLLRLDARLAQCPALTHLPLPAISAQERMLECNSSTKS